MSMLYALPSLWKPGFERADSATEEVEWFLHPSRLSK